MLEQTVSIPSIRPARAEDAAFLGWAIYEAARGHLARGWFDIVLRRNETLCLEFCRRLTLAKAHCWWHWSLFSVAEVNGERTSALCGFGNEAAYLASGDAMREVSDAMGISKAEQAELWPRGAFILSCTTSENRAWTIENVATRPAYRGLGVTQALLGHELARARAANFHRVQISFLIGNNVAERAYRKVGFTLAEEKRAPDFALATGASGLRRMARDL